MATPPLQSGDIKHIELNDFGGGILTARSSPINAPQNTLVRGENIEISNQWLSTRLGYRSCVLSPIMANSTIERLFYVYFPTMSKSYVLAQARSSTSCKLFVSNTPLPSSEMQFTELFDLGINAGQLSAATLNDRCILTEGIAHPPLVFLGGLAEDGSDWVYPKQIFCTLNGTDFFDVTDDLCDNDPLTVFPIPALPASGGIYICFDVPTITGIYFDVANANSTTSDMIIEKFSGGAWVPLTIVDNTSVNGVTLSRSGTVTFSAAVSDYFAIAEVPGFWFRVRFALVESSSQNHYMAVDALNDIDQINWAGNIVYWHRDSDYAGTFRNASNNPVAVGAGTEVVVGSLVVFYDGASATIVKIDGDGTGAGGVTISLNKESISIVAIYRGLANSSGLQPNYYSGENGYLNFSTDYLTEVMTSDVTPSPYVVSASSHESWAGWKAFDQNNTDYCWKTSGSSGWLQIDLGSPKTINKYMIQAQNIASNRGYPKDWILYGSNNGSSWVSLHEVTGQSDPGQSVWVTFSFINGEPYRYFKLSISDCNAGDLAIGEWRLIESPLAVPQQICVGKSTDTSNIRVDGWTAISSCAVTQALSGESNIYYAVSFDRRNSWKAYKDALWRVIAFNDVGTWKYNTGSGFANAAINNEFCALKQAFQVSANKWTKSQIEAMDSAEWGAAGGFSSSVEYIDVAFGAQADNSDTSEFDKLAITGSKSLVANLDIGSSSDVTVVDLRGEIRYWNKGTEDYYGRFEGEEVAFGNDDVTDEGSGKTGFPAIAHGLSAGDKVRFYGFTNSAYNATHVVDSATTANKIVVSVTYTAETMSSSCKRRKVIAIGSGEDNEDVEVGCAIVFGDATVIIRDIDGDGTDPDGGIQISQDHDDGNISAIYALEVSSGALKVMKTTIQEGADPDGANNPNTLFATPLMTSNSTPSPCAVSGSWGGATDKVYLLFNQFCGRLWEGSESEDYGLSVAYTNDYVIFDYGSGGGAIINKYDIYGVGEADDGSYRQIKSWTLRGSNNGSDWTTLHEVDDYPIIEKTSSKCNWWLGQEGSHGGHFTFVNSTSYRYYKFTVDDTYSSWAWVSEIKLVESLPATYTYIPQQGSTALAKASLALDCSDWAHITGCTVTQTLSGTSAAYHALTFDGGNSYKVMYGSSWREVIKLDSGTWYYNNSETSTPDWQAAAQNNAQYAFRQALDIAQNRMTKGTLESLTTAQWESTGGWSTSVDSINVAIGLKGGTDIGAVDKYTFSYLIESTGTFEPINATTHCSVYDVKGTISRWEKSNNRQGRFTTATGVPVSLGEGKTNPDVEVGLLITFSDYATAYITSISGDGTIAGAVSISNDHSTGNIISITGLDYSGEKIVHTSYGDPDGSLNTSTISVTPALTSDTTPAPYEVTSSTDLLFFPWKAFNQSNTAANDCWRAGPSVDSGWLQFYFGSNNPKIVNKYYIKTQASTDTNSPRSWTLEASNNGTSWTVLDSRTDIDHPGSDTWLGPYIFTNANSYLYYRLNISESNGSSLAIGELKLVGAQRVICEAPLVCATVGSIRITPSPMSYVDAAFSSVTLPTNCSIKYQLSFDEGNTYKIYSSGWRDVVKLENSQWKYITDVESPIWQDASPNTKLEALRHAPSMSNSSLIALTSAQWRGTGGFQPGDTIDLAYYIDSDGQGLPVVSSVGFQCNIDPTYIIMSLSKVTFRAPCQYLQNIHGSGTGDLVLGFVTHQVLTNRINNYAVQVSDGQLGTGAPIGEMTPNDYIYVGGVERFVSIQVTIGNDANNTNTASLLAEYWNGKEWQPLDDFTDGTSLAGKTFAKRGEIAWTSPSDWRQNKPLNYSLVMGYWVRFSVTSTLSSGVLLAEVRITSQPTPLTKHKFALSFANRLALANRLDARDQVDISRPYEEYGFTGSDSVSIRVGAQDQIIGVVRSYDQMWMTKLEDWYQITSSSLVDLSAPRGESAAQAPINNTCICLAPIDKYGKSQIGPIADAKNKQGVYFLNHNGAWCFTGAELFKLGDWVNWWERNSDNPKLDLDYLHNACATYWAFKNWLIWAAPVISGTGIAQTYNNKLMVYDINNGVWLPFFSISAASLCQARRYQPNAPSSLGEVVLLAGGYDGKIYHLFPYDAEDDDGAPISCFAETQWLAFDSPYVEKIIRSIRIYGIIASGNINIEISTDGCHTTTHTFSVSSLVSSGQEDYRVDFSHQNIHGKFFKIKLNWTGKGSVLGITLEIAPLRQWPDTSSE